MIVKTPQDFLQALDSLDLKPVNTATPKGVFLLEPTGFTLSTSTAEDNLYMDLSLSADTERACGQHRQMAEYLQQQGVVVVRFPGLAATPDCVFPNNVFATAAINDSRGHFIVGSMKTEERRQEAKRQDIRSFFKEMLGYKEFDLSLLDCVAELTGTLIIDRARGIGFCGMTQRVNDAGVEAMHQAFDLNLTFQFDLNADEYHTNVVMAILASRACVIYPEAFVDRDVPDAIAQLYPDRTLILSKAEKQAFAGNCISLSDSDVYMSETAATGLRPQSREKLTAWGFDVHGIPVDELEKAGGSLRCMIGEIF